MEPKVQSSVSREPLPLPFSFMDQVHGKDLGNGWIQYTTPHQDFRYFYHQELRLVTDYDLSDHDIRTKFLSRYKQTAEANHPLETFVQKSDSGDKEVSVINHDLETLVDGENSADESRASYWKYLYVYPCHYKLPDGAEKQALRVLHFAMTLNLTSTKGNPRTPFSMQDIRGYMEFFNLFQSVSTPPDENPVAKSIIIAIIIANFYMHRLFGTAAKSSPERVTLISSLKRIILNITCCGMSPNYRRRFELASQAYQQTTHEENWESFLDQVREERAAANIVSGLLLTSSVSFLAIPTLVDVAQFFIILSIALSLCSLVIGINTGVEERLLQIQLIPPLEHESHIEEFRAMARTMEYHYTTLLLSILCFFSSLLASTAYNIYASVGLHNSITTVKYLFFSMAGVGIIMVIWTTSRLNRRLL